MVKLELHWQILIGMVAGACLGILANFTLSKRQTELTEDLPNGVESARISDSTDRIEVSWIEDGTRKTYTVDPTGRIEDSFLTLADLENESELAVELYEMAPSYAHLVGDWSKRIGGLFLRLLQMISVPLIIASLASGVLGLGGASRFGRMFSYTLGYYVITSALAITTGLAVTNIINPGLGSDIRLDVAKAQVVGSSGLIETLMQQVESMIPVNPFEAIANSSFLSIISFTIVFCIFALKVGGETLERFKRVANDAFEVMMRLTTAIIKLAPLGVFLLMIYVTATQGLAVFSALAWYMLAVMVALAFHSTFTLPLLVWLFARRNPFELMRDMMPALLTAFSSASSNATLPLTLNNIEKRAGVSNRVSSFVLPLGATINMDGTALYEAVAVLFIGQLALGTEMEFADQLAIALTALLASVGAAGIPHAGLVMMAIVLQAVNLPIEYQGIILAVDRVLDMFRTSTNVWSDSCGTTIVERMSDGAASTA